MHICYALYLSFIVHIHFRKSLNGFPLQQYKQFKYTNNFWLSELITIVTQLDLSNALSFCKLQKCHLLLQYFLICILNNDNNFITKNSFVLKKIVI